MTRRHEMMIGAAALIVLAMMVVGGGLSERTREAVDWQLLSPLAGF